MDDKGSRYGGGGAVSRVGFEHGVKAGGVESGGDDKVPGDLESIEDAAVIEAFTKRRGVKG